MIILVYLLLVMLILNFFAKCYGYGRDKTRRYICRTRKTQAKND